MTATDRTPELSDLAAKMVGEMRKERGAELLSPQFLGALAARACAAVGADVSDPRSIVRSVEEHACPGCGSQYRHGAHGCSCVHVAGCTWKAGTGDVASGGPLAG